MDKKINEIVSQIETFSENAESTEKQILEKINKHFRDKWNEKYVEAYLKREKKVAEICKDFGVSTKQFYKVIKEKGIGPKKYKRSK